MSIQSTLDVSREKAENLALHKYIENNGKEIKARFVVMEDKELEDYLDEHFYNYNII